MRKIYELDELDCAACGAKMEAAIAKIDGVEAVSVSFITQKLTIETDDLRHDKIMKEAVKICRRIEPDCKIILK